LLGARLIVWLGVPVGLLAIALTITLLNSWGKPGGLCATWLAPVLSDCFPPAPPVEDDGRSV
jgi:hypothetical protein